MQSKQVSILKPNSGWVCLVGSECGAKKGKHLWRRLWDDGRSGQEGITSSCHVQVYGLVGANPRCNVLLV